jgi:hypothetical protein
MEWPNWLFRNIDGILLGNLKRSRNMDRIDMSSNCGITGETKDHKNRIGSDEMKGILLRVPQNSRVHFVLTNELLKRPDFSGKATFCDLQGKNTKLSTCVFVSLEGGNMKEIPGLINSSSPDCAVIFLLM